MNSTLGLLPEQPRNPASIIASTVCNLSILGSLLLFGAIATQHVVTQKFEETTLYLPPSTPPPPIKIKITPPPPVVAPVPTVIQPPVMDAPKIQIQRPSTKPDTAPVKLPEAKASAIPPTNQAPHIVLAPQPKAAINIAQAQNPSQLKRDSVAAIHFWSPTGNASSIHQSVTSVGLGSFQTGVAGHSTGRVASAGFASLQVGATGHPIGKVASVGLPPQITSAMSPVSKLRVEPAMTQIEVLSGPKPEYTEEARQLRIQGSVVLRVTIASTGQVRVLGILRGLGHGLDQSAERAVEQYRIKPATKDGIPVETTTNFTITFQLA